MQSAPSPRSCRRRESGSPKQTPNALPRPHAWAIRPLASGGPPRRPEENRSVGSSVRARLRLGARKNEWTPLRTKPVCFTSGEQEGECTASTGPLPTVRIQRTACRSAQPNVVPRAFTLLRSACSPCMVMFMQQIPKPPANRSLELTRSGRRPCPRCAEVHVASRGHGHLPPRAAQLQR